MYALRLPEAERAEALRANGDRSFVVNGITWLNLDQIGEEWAFGHWGREEVSWCLAAYEWAGDIRT